jgi:7,8-dihydropterin-6-yl-methyl-4-(beta-D-ribofuranosyl)aminobenzene 5'-phosphate synthase
MKRPVLKRIMLYSGLCLLLIVTAVIKPLHLAAAPDYANTDLQLTLVYDNNPYDTNLESKWGFSCYIRTADNTILFDTGGDGSVLLRNMEKLQIDPKTVDTVVLSHVHSDHIGGLPSFLAAHSDVTVYIPHSILSSVGKTIKNAGAQVAAVKNPMKICKNVYSTGELGGGIKEQSLIINTNKGSVVITGCAHPGIVNIIKRSKEILGNRVYLVLGGFHLAGMDDDRIKNIVRSVKAEGVVKVAPCHCSGDRARKNFKEAYGSDCIIAGVGKKIVIRNAF